MGAATAEKPKAASSNGTGQGEGEGGDGGEQRREPLDGEHGDEQPKPKVPAIELEGRGQLSLKIGGANPDKATAKLVGGKIAIPKGEYQPGEVIEAVVRLRVSKVAINHKVNDGETIEVEREHQFKMLQIEAVTG
jgi:hypothetical protein